MVCGLSPPVRSLFQKCTHQSAGMQIRWPKVPVRNVSRSVSMHGMHTLQAVVEQHLRDALYCIVTSSYNE